MLPLPEGVNQKTTLYNQGRLTANGITERLLSSSTILHDLSGELAFFSHAPLLCFGGLPVDPVQHWINQQPRSDILVGPIEFDFELVEGLPSYSNTLWFCELGKAWDGLRKALAGVVVVDPSRKSCVLSQLQQAKLIDPLFLSRCAVLPEKLPVVDVTLYGLTINGTRHLFRGRPPGSRSQLVFEKATEDGSS